MDPWMAACETRTKILDKELSTYYPLTFTFEDLGAVCGYTHVSCLLLYHILFTDLCKSFCKLCIQMSSNL